MNTILVVGSAPCLYDDLSNALQLRPFASVMLVNGACSAVEKAEHVLSGHTDKAELFAAERRKAFPNAAPWRLHATITEKHRHEAKIVFPSVTDWWGKDMCTGATSIAKGARIGFAMGFEEVILCGAPMDGSGYAPAEAKVGHDCHRVGDPAAQDRRVIAGYRTKFAKLAKGEFKDKVFSMSGFTKECLGAPR